MAGYQTEIAREDVSDADSEELELEQENARLEQSVQDFLDSYRQPGDQPRASRPKKPRRPSKGLVRRKEVEPRGDIKLRLSQVNSAFLRGDYNEAERMIKEIIRINAETYQAWITLATICEDEGRDSDALTAKLYASHLRPKDDVAWVSCATLALHIAGDDNDSPILKTAGTCFAQAILAQPHNLEARLGRAEVNHRRGHLVKATREYAKVLEHHPNDIAVIRKLADASEATQRPEDVKRAVQAYRQYFQHVRDTSLLPGDLVFWGDVSIYAELLGCLGNLDGALHEVKMLARWLLSRADETYWDDHTQDDREWDEDKDRRLEVSQFDPTQHDSRLYGIGLPLELRAYLALFRLRLGDVDESNRHLAWIDPNESATASAAEEFPGLVRDIADALYEEGFDRKALDYYELLRSSTYSQDAALLFNLGKCYLKQPDIEAAEECFLLAIEANEDSIDARVELARIYESAHEDEEALILVTEAIALRSMGFPTNESPELPATEDADANNQDKDTSTQQKSRRGRKARPGNIVQRRYRPKRLVSYDQRRREERERADELTKRYKEVRDLKRDIRAGARDKIPAWMAAAKDLVDDFRSFRKFYTWDKYVKYLGAANEMVFNAPYQIQPGNSELHRLAERLQRNVAPVQKDDERNLPDDDGYRGIPFSEWLELFLDYAISLALAGNGEDAYQVCEAARDSIVFTNSKDYMFLIHVAWAACAVYLADEEVCVAMGRYFAKVNYLDSDSYRMFAALCRLCQSPASWYNSGPVQKYILRQIRFIDNSQLEVARLKNHGSGDVGQSVSAQGDVRNLDVCLLMLYGHILFTSTSYTFALNYFLRARALDPTSPMVNLSVGLGYVHHAFKRQADNRQYLIMQGLSCIFEYARERSQESTSNAREAQYTVARVFHLLGLHHLAHEGYFRALDSRYVAAASLPGEQDIVLSAAFNQLVLLLISGDVKSVEQDILQHLVL